MLLSGNHSSEHEKLTPWTNLGCNKSWKYYLAQTGTLSKDLRDRLTTIVSESTSDHHLVVIVEADFINHFLVDLLGLTFNLQPLVLWQIILFFHSRDYNLRHLGPKPLWRKDPKYIELGRNAMFQFSQPTGLRISTLECRMPGLYIENNSGQRSYLIGDFPHT